MSNKPKSMLITSIGCNGRGFAHYNINILKTLHTALRSKELK